MPFVLLEIEKENLVTKRNHFQDYDVNIILVHQSQPQKYDKL